MMHWEKKHLMALCFRQYLDHRFLISISIHLLQQPGSQPLFFPRDPSLRQPLPQIALFHLAWYYRISYGSPIFKAVPKKRCKALYRALKKSPKSPELAVGAGSEPSYVDRSVGAP